MADADTSAKLVDKGILARALEADKTALAGALDAAKAEGKITLADADTSAKLADKGILARALEADKTALAGALDAAKEAVKAASDAQTITNAATSKTEKNERSLTTAIELLFQLLEDSEKPPEAPLKPVETMGIQRVSTLTFLAGM